jgi:hypothetical protein
MRRLVPWFLLGLLTVGTAAGIALGVANQPGQTPAQWLASALAATVRAGTVRVSERDVTLSSNAGLRTANTTSSLFDFTHDAAQETSLIRFPSGLRGPFGPGSLAAMTTRFDFVVRGRDVYTGIDIGGSEQWAEEVDPRNAPSLLSPEGTPDAPLMPPGLNGHLPVTALRDVGTAIVARDTTTEYSVSLGPLPGCPRTKGAASNPFDESPWTVWIDGSGRIVEERTVVRQVFQPLRVLQHESGSGSTTTHGQFQLIRLRQQSGTSSTVTTVRFTDFGAPVSIKVPSIPRRDVHRLSPSTARAEATLCPTGVGVAVGSSSAPGPHHASKAHREEPMLRGARQPPR